MFKKYEKSFDMNQVSKAVKRINLKSNDIFEGIFKLLC
jgi:hypothetical protein